MQEEGPKSACRIDSLTIATLPSFLAVVGDAGVVAEERKWVLYFSHRDGISLSFLRFTSAVKGESLSSCHEQMK
jgi:hypothetical protein